MVEPKFYFTIINYTTNHTKLSFTWKVDKRKQSLFQTETQKKAIRWPDQVMILASGNQDIVCFRLSQSGMILLIITISVTASVLLMWHPLLMIFGNIVIQSKISLHLSNHSGMLFNDIAHGRWRVCFYRSGWELRGRFRCSVGGVLLPCSQINRW